MPSATKPVLYYFDLVGRGDAIRLAFAVGHIDYEDHLISFADWPTKYKPNMPAGQVPVLELNGVKYCESNAILYYAAQRAKLIPGDDELALRMYQAVTAVNNVYVLSAPIAMAKPEDKEAVRKAEESKIHDAMVAYGKMIGRTQHSKGYIAGDKLSAADLAVYALIKHYRHPFLGYPASFGDDVPQIKKVMDLVESIPEVRAYYKM